MTTNIEAPDTASIAHSRQSGRVLSYGLHRPLVEEGTEAKIYYVLSQATGDDSMACNLQPRDMYGWMILREIDTGVEFSILPGKPLATVRAAEPIPVEDLELTPDWSVPEIHYDSDTAKWWRFYTPWIQEAIDRGVALARHNSVSVERVRVSRFVSIEDERYEECVISFYSRSNRSSLIAFSPTLAEKLGEWIDSQSELVPEEIEDLLSFEILPMEFWRDVRS